MPKVCISLLPESIWQSTLQENGYMSCLLSLLLLCSKVEARRQTYIYCTFPDLQSKDCQGVSSCAGLSLWCWAWRSELPSLGTRLEVILIYAGGLQCGKAAVWHSPNFALPVWRVRESKGLCLSSLPHLDLKCTIETKISSSGQDNVAVDLTMSHESLMLMNSPRHRINGGNVLFHQPAWWNPGPPSQLQLLPAAALPREWIWIVNAFIRGTKHRRSCKQGMHLNLDTARMSKTASRAPIPWSKDRVESISSRRRKVEQFAKGLWHLPLPLI